MMLRSVLLLLSLCCALPAQIADDIRIGTWNIEFLGADSKYRRDTPPRTAEDVELIGKKVRDLGCAVLGVQEICGEEPLQAVAKAAGPTWRAVLGTTGKWSDGKTQQGVGFLYNSAVVRLVHAEEMLDFPSERDGVSVFHRKPVTACFAHLKTGSDFRVVIVHLKAGRKARDLQKRKAEATHMREWVAKLLENPREDRDIVIMGDFNSTYGADPEKVLESGGLMQYIDQEKSAPTIMHFDEPIDQFCVSTGFREVQRNSFVSHHVSGASERLLWRKTYSDHFPVTLRMTPLADDDADSTFHRGPANQVLPTTRRKSSASSTAVAPSWPLRAGTLVKVVANDRIFAGKLRKMPAERGWIVIETAGTLQAINMANVTVVQTIKQ